MKNAVETPKSEYIDCDLKFRPIVAGLSCLISRLCKLIDILLQPFLNKIVVVMPQTILTRRNRRCTLSATGTRKPEEEKDARDVTYFMEENVISPHEVARFNEHIRN